MSKRNTAIISIELPPDVAKWLKEKARGEFRSIRKQAAAILTDHVKTSHPKLARTQGFAPTQNVSRVAVGELGVNREIV